MTIASISFVVTTLGADVACDVGVYDATFARVAVAAAVTGKLNTTGVKNIPLDASYIVRAGTIYYAAWSANAGQTAQLQIATVNSAAFSTAFGTTPGKVIFDYQAAAHPLPASLTGNAGGIASGPALILNEA
jgi:hypothetical protein